MSKSHVTVLHICTFRTNTACFRVKLEFHINLLAPPRVLLQFLVPQTHTSWVLATIDYPLNIPKMGGGGLGLWDAEPCTERKAQWPSIIWSTKTVGCLTSSTLGLLVHIKNSDPKIRHKRCALCGAATGACNWPVNDDRTFYVFYLWANTLLTLQLMVLAITYVTPELK